MHLRRLGHQLRERPAEPDRLGREVAAGRRRGVALVEDQVDDREHGVEPLGQQVLGRHPEGDPGGRDLALRPDEALRHRRLGDQERARDLRRAEPAERAQRQRDLRLGRERRVAAQEHELEPLIRERRGVRDDLRRVGDQQVGLRGERAVAPDPVDRPVARGADQPGPRVRRFAVARPAFGGDRERLLRGFLGEVHVAEEADQGREDEPPFVAEDVLEDRYHSTIGRTSIAPPIRAAGIRAASSIAPSRSSAS